MGNHIENEARKNNETQRPKWWRRDQTNERWMKDADTNSLTGFDRGADIAPSSSCDVFPPTVKQFLWSNNDYDRGCDVVVELFCPSTPEWSLRMQHNGTFGGRRS